MSVAKQAERTPPALDADPLARNLVTDPEHLPNRHLLQRADLSGLLFVASFVLVVRLPMSVIMLGALPIIVIAWHGLRRGTGLRARPLWWFIGVSLITSAGGVALNLKGAGVVVNSFTLMVAIAALAIAVFYTGRTELAARRLLQGTMWGLIVLWAIGCMEVVTNYKLLPHMYPTSAAIPDVLANRLYASAIYTNYNDFCVSLVLLCTVLVAKLLLDRGAGAASKIFAGIVVGTSVVLIVAMGSRGALLALFASVGLTMFWVVRMRHPEIPHARWRLSGSVVLLLGLAVLWGSSFIQDRSTAGRVGIIGNAISMLTHDPLKIVFGYGSFTGYTAAAATAYPGILMDPHNLFLEFVLCYGAPALLMYVWCWVWLVRRFWRHTRPASWWTVGAMVNAVLAPVLGVVPSSTLRYYLVYVFLICACASTALDHRTQRQLTDAG